MEAFVPEVRGCGSLGFAATTAILAIGLAALSTCAQSTAPSLPDTPISDEFIVQSWTTGNGLPHDEIHVLRPSRTGVLWIGTRAGLARFDGTRFATFDHLNTPAFVSDDCTALAEEADGGLWIGTTHGLVYRDRNRVFRRFTQADGLPHDHITSLLVTRRGQVWVSTMGGVARRDATAWKVYGQERDGGLTVSGVGTIAEDAEGGIWAASARGLDAFSVHDDRFRTGLGSGLEAWRDARFFPLRPNAAWDALLWSMGREQARWMRWTSNAWSFIRTVDLDNAGRPHFLCPDSRGGTWTPTGARRIARLDAAGARFYSLPTGGIDDYAISAALDRSGNLWLGTERSGLIRLRPRRFETVGRQHGLANENVWALAETPDRTLWIGTEQGLAQRRSGSSSMSVLRRANGMPHDDIRALATDSRGEVWIGGIRGASVLRSERPEPIRLPTADDADKVRIIHAGPTGTRWIGTLRGLHRIPPDSIEPRVFFSSNAKGFDVRSVLETPEGTLWVGTDGAGLYRFDSHHPEISESVAGLSNPRVWSIHRDTDRVLWVTTEQGLNRIENDRVFAFYQHHGLPENQINHLVEDDAGQFWCGTERGIFRVSKADLNRLARDGDGEVACALYDDADGMPTPETNGQKSHPAGIRTRDGRIWFATARGAVGFDPREVHDAETLAIPGIERVRARGRTVFSELPANGDEPLGSYSTDPTGALRLPPGSGHTMEFAFEGRHLSAPQRIRFRYRLAGFETQWTETGSRREAFYTNLKPGRYRFELLAASRHGLWNPTPATLAFEIVPFLHQTLAFRVACVVAGILVVAAIWLWRMRELRRIHRLESIAAISDERRRIATDLHDHVGADLTHLTLLAEIAELRDHPMSTEALQNLSTRARRATEALRDTIWATLPEHQNLARLVDRIGDMATQLLGAAEIRVTLVEPPVVDPVPLPPETCRGVYLAAKEVLHNAVRHSGASRVEVRWEIHDREVLLTVLDDGRGLGNREGTPDGSDSKPEEEEGSPSAGPAPSFSFGGGLGLAGIRRRLESLGGRVEIDSAEGRGTRVALRFPKG